jgi:hypothetical protein
MRECAITSTSGTKMVDAAREIERAAIQPHGQLVTLDDNPVIVTSVRWANEQGGARLTDRAHECIGKTTCVFASSDQADYVK